MLKIGHRGAKGYAPENTLVSFQKAIELGCDGIELDVWLTKDDQVVVIHDETIDRTTNRTGKINDYLYNEIAGFDIPTLENVIKLVNQRCFINIEIKDAKATEFVVEIINEHVEKYSYSYSHFIVSSFDWISLQQIILIDDKIQIGVLTATDLDLAFAFAKFIKAKTINPYFHLLNKENVVKIQNAGLEIHTWTVNEIEDIEKIKSLKVNGIISDFPDRI